VPEPTEIDEATRQAVQAMLAVLGPVVDEDTATRALQAAHEVYEAEEGAFVQSQLDQTLLGGLDVTDRGARVRFQMARETAAGIVLAFKDLLGDAENYVEQEVVDRETLERYVCIVVRPGRKTPHELRREAEEALERVRRLAVEYVSGHDPRWRPLATATGEVFLAAINGADVAFPVGDHR
jgi:hypothetical protein